MLLLNKENTNKIYHSHRQQDKNKKLLELKNNQKYAFFFFIFFKLYQKHRENQFLNQTNSIKHNRAVFNSTH